LSPHCLKFSVDRDKDLNNFWHEDEEELLLLSKQILS
jgi:hypothetical protein